MSKHFKIKSKIIGLGLALVAPFSIVGGLSLATKPALADESTQTLSTSHRLIQRETAFQVGQQ